MPIAAQAARTGVTSAIMEGNARFGVRYSADLQTIDGANGPQKTMLGGRITILEKIGSGGFCKVYKCEKSIKRTTVFKGCEEEEERPGT